VEKIAHNFNAWGYSFDNRFRGKLVAEKHHCLKEESIEE